MIRSTLDRFADRLRDVAPAPLVSHYSSLRFLRDRGLVFLALANFLDQMSVSLVVPLLPIYAAELGVSPLLVGAMFAAETFSKAVFSIPFGYLSDRFDRRSLVAAGVSLSALSVVALGFVHDPYLFIALRAVDGAATAMRAPATTAYVGDRYDESELGSAMGAYRTLGMLGVALGPAFGGILAATEGLAFPFVVLGCGTLLGGVLVFFFLPAGEGSRDDPTAEEDVRSFWTRSPRRALDAVTVPMAAIGASVFVSQIGTGAFGPMFAVLLEENLAVGPGYVGTAWSVFGLSMFLFVPVGGTLADRAGRKRSLVAGKVTWAVVVVGLALTASRVVPPLLLFLAGIASAFAGPALGALQYEVAPDGREGTVLGVYSALASAGMALGPVLGGAVATRFGTTAVFLAMGVLWLLDTGTIAVGVRETETPNPARPSGDARGSDD